MSGTYADSEQSAVLDALAKLLIDSIPVLSTKNCFISILEDPPQMPSDDVFVTVAPTAGDFPEEFQDGGGPNQCTEYTGAIISIFSRFQANRPGQERDALSDFARGILKMKRLVLKAVVGKNLTSAADGNQVLRELIKAKKSSFPAYVNNEQLVKVGIEVSTPFDWNLTL